MRRSSHDRSTNLHGFDDGDDARRPEAADGGEHGDGQVVVRWSPVHQGDAGRHLHGMDLSWRDGWVGPASRHVGLTLSGREGQSEVAQCSQSSFHITDTMGHDLDHHNVFFSNFGRFQI